MQIQSIWYEGVNVNGCAKLTKDIMVDVLIIGGGITGCSIAYHLRGKKDKICLVDRNIIGCSTTSKSTGKLTYLQDGTYYKLNKALDKESALNYFNSQKKAIEIVKKIIKDNHIDCDIEQVPTTTYTNSKENINKLKYEAEFLRDNNIDVTISKNSKFSSKYAITVEGCYIFNPLKYVNALKDIIISAGVQVYEDTNVVKVYKEGNRYICLTDNKKISAKKVVFACHYPYFTVPFLMPLKTYKEKSTLIASKMKKVDKQSGINIDNDVISYRNYKDYLILLNDCHKICDDNKLDEKQIKKKFNKYINDIDYYWTNHDIMTGDHLPYIGRIKKGEDMFIATGYNTWGLTNGSIAGKIISDMILNKNNKYVKLFDPNRSINLAKFKNGLVSMKSNVKAYIKPKKKEYIEYKKINGKKVAIYIDNSGISHFVYTKCPHMKCGLIFNDKEKTWDCPCHGSRFDIYGNCILGPSKYNITYKEDQ